MENLKFESIGPSRIEKLRDSALHVFNGWLSVNETGEDYFLARLSGAREENFSKFTDWLQEMDAGFEVLEKHESTEHDNWPTYTLKITLQ